MRGSARAGFLGVVACVVVGCGSATPSADGGGHDGTPRPQSPLWNEDFFVEPVEPALPTGFSLAVGPRRNLCDVPQAVERGWSSEPCHVVAATWQGVDSDRALYQLVRWPPDAPAGDAVLPIGPSALPHIGTSYAVTFAARPAQHLCVALVMYNQRGTPAGPVEACTIMPAGDGEVVPTTVQRPPMTTFPPTTTTTIRYSPELLPSPLPAPADFVLTVGELQNPCAHRYAGAWSGPCYIVTAEWQSLDDDRMRHSLTPTVLPSGDGPAPATLPLGPDRYERSGTAYSVTIAARPAQELCVGLRAMSVYDVRGSDGAVACVTVP